MLYQEIKKLLLNRLRRRGSWVPISCRWWKDDIFSRWRCAKIFSPVFVTNIRPMATCPLQWTTIRKRTPRSQRPLGEAERDVVEVAQPSAVGVVVDVAVVVVVRASKWCDKRGLSVGQRRGLGSFEWLVLFVVWLWVLPPIRLEQNIKIPCWSRVEWTKLTYLSVWEWT